VPQRRTTDGQAADRRQRAECQSLDGEPECLSNDAEPHVRDPVAVLVVEVARVEQVAEAMFRPPILAVIQAVSLLHDVFSRVARVSTRDATISVRTGRESVTYEVTRAVLKDVFPRHRIARRARPFVRPTQTQLFGDREQKVGEADLILTRT